MKTRIELFKSNNAWIAAEFVDGKPNPRLVDLFGTHEIPTPFTAMATAKEVLDKIQELNPGTEVVVRS